MLVAGLGVCCCWYLLGSLCLLFGVGAVGSVLIVLICYAIAWCFVV